MTITLYYNTKVGTCKGQWGKYSFYKEVISDGVLTPCRIAKDFQVFYSWNHFVCIKINVMIEQKLSIKIEL